MTETTDKKTVWNRADWVGRRGPGNVATDGIQQGGHASEGLDSGVWCSVVPQPSVSSDLNWKFWGAVTLHREPAAKGG